MIAVQVGSEAGDVYDNEVVFQVVKDPAATLQVQANLVDSIINRHV